MRVVNSRLHEYERTAYEHMLLTTNNRPEELKHLNSEDWVTVRIVAYTELIAQISASNMTCFCSKCFNGTFERIAAHLSARFTYHCAAAAIKQKEEDDKEDAKLN